MKEKDPLNEAFDRMLVLLFLADDNTEKLPFEVQTFMYVNSAQGVIDNGGYRNFFGSDWPNNPTYSKFINAYRTIGCQSQADDFQKVSLSFPFDNPHLKEKERIKYMDDNYDEEGFCIKGWGDSLCGDNEVWEKLERYYKKNIEKFV